MVIICRSNKYHECLFNANCKLNELLYYTELFYPDTSGPDKIARFRKDGFATACDDVIDAFEELNKLNTKKKYSDEHLAENIYNALDSKRYFMFNTQVIIGSIKRKKDQLLRLSDYPDLSCVAGHFLAFNDILIDVSTFLIRFAQWKGIKTNSWPYAQMRKSITSYEVFSSGCFISQRIAHINDLSIPPLAIFLLRQAIELKIREILNIYSILDKKDNIVRITGDKFLPLLNENNFILPVKKSILEKIHKWANEYVHLGSIDCFWKVEFAQFYLMDFFVLKHKVLALKPYYENEMQKDIQKIVQGECKIDKLREEPQNVELVEADTFSKAQAEIKKIGFINFFEKKEKEYLAELERRVRSSE